jgi:membrane protein
MIASAAMAKRALSMFGRVFPRCMMVSQAVAYNLFLAFFPTLLIAVGFATSPLGGRTALFDLIADLTRLLPAASQQLVSQFLVQRGPQAWKWAVLGWAGTVIAGSQVMRLIMEGIHLVYGDRERSTFLQRELRSVALLIVTIAPLLAAAFLGVFGRPLRHWLGRELGRPASLMTLWAVFFHGISIILAMVSLTIIYRVARPKETSLRSVLPGAMVATLLWWITDIGFGFYVRKVNYSVVYGGLAAAIGLLIWMQLSAIIIFLGAAWNAERSTALAKSRSYG